MADTEFFTIGHIVAPHGVRGDVRIYPDTDFPERFLEMKYAYIDGVKYAVKEARFHKRVVLVKFDGT
ncbi:putative 16S rRNA processing protein RimM [Anaeroglobus geminatus F0357]|uniref:Putative 16S rRNA processing protein RimM n=1 Tax=Anaeroglobus geminatus F0357 TaxID=861450 RepID=G9YID3_9FIRM|nr:putative 16S rRNA processing protein RimM [Anaeroglobus geminatus F0357]